jgi:hypothetical protein
VNEFREETIKDLTEALDHPLLFERSLEDRTRIAEHVATRLFMSGWIPPRVPTEELEEEWRAIPGFSAWQASNKGFIRHALSHVWVPISAILGEIQPVTLYDDHGRDVALAYDQIMDTTFPKEGTEILFDNGSVAHIPDAGLTGGSRVVEIVEEEWRVIPDLPTRAYEVNKSGVIRIAHNKKVLPLEGYDIDYNMEVVEVRINGATFMLNGPIIARELFRK